MVTRVVLALAGASALAGCGDEADDSLPEVPCLAPNRVVGERCIEPGVQDDGCPAGTLGMADGSCRAPGAAAEGCAEGFVHEGELCAPILPAESCAPGTMAVPGDTSCRPIMPCGEAPWGGIPVEPGTQYVDAAYAGGDSDGSAQHPWTSVADAIEAAAPGMLVAIAPGTYGELLVITSPIRLWGLCPERVEIGEIQIQTNADGTELHGLASTGRILLSGSEDVLVDRVWIHDAPGRGIEALPTLGPPSLVVSGSLIERNEEMGIYASGTRITLEGSVVRQTQPLASDQMFGRGLNFQVSCTQAGCDPNALTLAQVTRSVIEENQDVGVYVSGSEVVIDGSVVRRTNPRVADLAGGRGVSIRVTCGGGICARSNVVMTSTLIEQNHDDGLLASGSDLTLENVAVRATQPRASDGLSGRGMTIQPCRLGDSCDRFERAIVSMRGLLVDQSFDAGIFLGASDVTIEASVVRNTAPPPDDPYDIGAILAQACTATDGCVTPERSQLTLKGSRVEDSLDVGILLVGSDVLIEGTHVRRTFRRSLDRAGHGVHAQVDCAQVSPELQCDPNTRTFLTLKASRIEETDDMGLVVVAADATIEGVLIERTNSLEGILGDGVLVFSEVAPATLHATSSLIAQSARAGVSNFGANVSLGNVAITCAALDLDGEHVGPLAFAFEDRGSNTCGCPTANSGCKLVTSGLTPPNALPTPE